MQPGAVACAGFIRSLLGLAALGAPVAVLQAGAVGGLVAGTTDYVFRGVSQTRGGPAGQAGIQYRFGDGWFLGAWGSGVDLNRGTGSTVELNFFGGRSWQLGPAWSARIAAVHYMYPNDTEYLSYDYDEVVGTVSFRDRLAASIAWSPNTSRYSNYGVARYQTAYTFDLVGRLPLFGPLSAVGGIGYYGLQDLFGTGYTYGSVGVACNFDHLQVDMTFYSTSHTAEELFGPEVAGNRWSLTAAWRF